MASAVGSLWSAGAGMNRKCGAPSHLLPRPGPVGAGVDPLSFNERPFSERGEGGFSASQAECRGFESLRPLCG